MAKETVLTKTKKEYLGRLEKGGRVTIPPEIFKKLRMRKGDFVAFIQKDDAVLMMPKSAKMQANPKKPAIDYSKFPNADDEYTPRQRKVVDAELAKSLDDFKNGRTYGPFHTHEEMIGFLHDSVRKAEKTTYKSKNHDHPSHAKSSRKLRRGA